MSKARTVFACTDCGQQIAQWVGRCPGCGGWGTIQERVQERAGGTARARAVVSSLGRAPSTGRRTSTGSPGVDRVLGGGLVEAGVVLLAGEPGIGKSTLLLQMVANLSAAGLPCLLASGEESHEQVAARAERLGVPVDAVSFVSGRELPAVMDAARSERPFLLAVDSIQTLRDPDAGQMVGGPSQVRSCADALIGIAKSEGIAVVLTGHVTKDGDLAGPRTLEHAVDAVLSFEGDPRSGLRMLCGGKNRFGPEGEVAWFEMQGDGLHEIDPSELLMSGSEDPGSAVALLQAGRRGLAVEIQALVVSTDLPARRQASGLDGRRFSLVAAVLAQAGLIPRAADLFGATAGGVRVDDPACDLAMAAALASSAKQTAVPPRSAFVGEVALTGAIRPAPSMEQRLAAARAAGVRTVFAALGSSGGPGLDVVTVRHVKEALTWASSRSKGRRT